MDVAEFTTTFVADPDPKVTEAPVAKLVPPMVTTVPPVVGPAGGDTLVTLGGGL